ncbi:MAG: hypothetical protein FWC30_05010, partial [Candidatus Bathyarchaeota archaeon]|nr:hypothetical protein [Candidatus Termiticorpusculum sp.]
MKHCRDKGYCWIGDIKSNRVVYYRGEKFALSDLYDLLCEVGWFVDVVVGGEIYLVCGVKVYVAEIGDVL